MRDLPSGTVTFVFTDIEGSTRLLESLGDRYADLLSEHRHVVRGVFTARGGVEVDTQGDAFFYAFTHASQAVAAATEVQRALGAGPVRTRIGVHTGEPARTEEGYVGMDVHRAARVAAAGHGGQVLLSASTRALVDRDVRDLGEHRLKDLSAPERIFQVGEGTFPPLKTLYATNLPIPATPFLGRDRDLRDVGDLLARPDVRLLTLAGTGGTGKTRLALQAAGAAAESYPHGVFWVPLAPLRDPTLVLEAAAQALGGAPDIAGHIADRRLLLLLDNFEHMIEAAPHLAALLAACPNLDLLVTSREVLRVPGEQVYPVPPLEPGDGERLFAARARAALPAFVASEAVPELCARLDNLPLALELAAARVRVLSPEQLLERLSSRLDLLKAGRGADPRQQTLRATIEWSHDLLGEQERRLFARLAVFPGGCTLEAAEEVCDAELDVLESLVDKSLLRIRDRDRFWMLETIRELAAERLEARGESEGLRRRHADRCLRLADSLGLSVEAIEDARVQHHDVAGAEQDNFRAAIDWGLEGDPELALRLAVALEQFWVINNPYEGMRRLEGLLERCRDAAPELRARAIRAHGGCANLVGEIELATADYRRSLALFRELGDERAIAHMEFRLAVTTFQLGEWGRARLLLEESVLRARDLGSQMLEAQALGSLGIVEHHEGNLERAFGLWNEAWSSVEQAGSCGGRARRSTSWLRMPSSSADWTRRRTTRARRLHWVAGSPTGG